MGGPYDPLLPEQYLRIVAFKLVYIRNTWVLGTKTDSRVSSPESLAHWVWDGAKESAFSITSVSNTGDRQITL